MNNGAYEHTSWKDIAVVIDACGAHKICSTYYPGLGKNILWSQYIVQYILLYNIIKFIVKQNIILYIYYCKIFYNILTIYCKTAYPLHVNIEALQYKYRTSVM